jgi:serine/threonine protein kinase/ABC-type branched-subunit amino acid transport system substrate-binding protein
MAPDDMIRPPKSTDETADHPRVVREVSDPLVGRILKGAYRIEGKVGEGGMGVVYRATQINLGRTVAVKMIRQDRNLRDTSVERFLREARLLSLVQHPSIVGIIEYGAEAGIHFIIMEFLHGDPLDLFVKLHRNLAQSAILEIMEQLCSAISAAHERRVIHRDLKPGNVFLIPAAGNSKPVVKVLDFGLGKGLDTTGSSYLTSEGAMMGTLCYSAPEQLGGGNVDAQADVYSLGAILYFLIAGRSPYLDEQRRGNLSLQLTSPPEPIDPARLGTWRTRAAEVVIHRAMSLKPADRHATPAALFADIREVLDRPETVWERRRYSLTEAPRLNPPADAPTTTAPRLTRRGWVVAVGVAATVGLAALGYGLRRSVFPANPGATAPGVTGHEILVGMSAPFSGPTAELGRAMQGGVETCFDAVNEAGGVHGRMLRLVALDDGYEPDRTHVTMRRLIDHFGVFAFLGNVGTPTAEVALPIAFQSDRVFFGAFSGASLLRKTPPDRLVFNYRASYAVETAAIVGYLLRLPYLTPEGIAVFAQKDGFGDAGFAGVARALRKYDIREGAIHRLGYDRNRNDIDSALSRFKAYRAAIKAVVMVATYQPAAKFIHGVRGMGSSAICANVSFVHSDRLAEELGQLGPRLREGVIVTQVVPHYDSSNIGVSRYRRDLEKYRPSAAPGFVSLEGYIAASAFVKGLRRAGPRLTTDSLVSALEGIRDLDLGIGEPIRFGPSRHQGSSKVWGTVLDEKGEHRNLDLD